MRGKRVVVTGVTGQIALPLAAHLAEHNTVFGLARFTEPDSRRAVGSLGIEPVRCDLGTGEFSMAPADVDYVLHLAVYQQPGLDFETALRVNAEGTGLLLQHYRAVDAAIVMSTHSVYRPHDDPAHVYVETDPLGDCHPPYAATYGIGKLGQEAVARSCSRMFDLPVTIARMNASYGTSGNGGLPGIHVRAVAAGQPVTTRWAPCLYQPIHQDDINAQIDGLLAIASTPAAILNWAGDEAVSVQQWCGYAGELLGVETQVQVVEVPGTLRGSCADVTRRAAAAGPCSISWREGIRRLVDHHLDANS